MKPQQLTHDPLYRAACRIRRSLSHRPPAADGLGQWASYLAESHEALARCWRRVRVARGRGWELAAARLHEDLFFHAQRLQGGAEALLACRDGPRTAPAAASVPSLLAELRQLREEFGGVEVDLRHGRVTVETEPVVLRGLRLGPFAIELHLGRLSARPDGSCFDCVALEPHPAESNESVTHPHVSGRGLCAGEASAAMAEALRQGRVCDAFVLVRSVLTHYNPASPYVSLEDWEGVRCPDCGGTAGRDDLCYCADCGRDVCGGCAGCCEVCDQSCCRSCLERGRVSRRWCCGDCRHSCGGCGRTVDADSHDDSGLCPECLEESSAEPEDPLPEEEDHPNERPTGPESIIAETRPAAEVA